MLPEFVTHLKGIERHGNQYMAKCPAHEDHKASLSVSSGDDGRILLYCHAGCSFEQVIEAMGLTQKDLYNNSPEPNSPTHGDFPQQCLFENSPKPTFPTHGDFTQQSSFENSPKPNFPTRNYFPQKTQKKIEDVYSIRDDNGEVIAQKVRYIGKTFAWRRPDGNCGWIYNRKGVPHRLYVAGELKSPIYVVEGEKDADNLHNLGCNVVSGMDGAGPGKWKHEYTEQLRGLNVIIIPDNDEVGREYAEETYAALNGIAQSVYLLDLSSVWPEIPEHGDISDMIQAKGAKETAELLVMQARTLRKQDKDASKPEPPTPTICSNSSERTPNTASERKSDTTSFDSLAMLVKPLEEFPELEPEWLVPGWMPSAQISLMAADGGVGKTTLWCHVVAALSKGARCILDPEGYTREPKRILFLTSEDSVSQKLLKKLRLAGANLSNIFTVDAKADKDNKINTLKFGSKELAHIIRTINPALCVFDPVQGFLDPMVNMSSRNGMRNCLAPLITLGEELGTTFLIICHTNKRNKASGRDRIADSADLWDIARSVMMVGFTDENGVRYLSNEKNNYASLQETVLFTIDDNEQVSHEGQTWKRDKDFVSNKEVCTSGPVREECKEFILHTLKANNGSMQSTILDDVVIQAGYSQRTVQRAKGELKKQKAINHYATGSSTGGDRVWYTKLTASP